MADFHVAYTKTMGNEGGYACDPDDTGGETYRGISRRYNPWWVGWEIVDAEKRSGIDGLNDRLNANTFLQEHVRLFYQEAFWYRINGDAIPYQSIADEVFDTAVNMGVTKAVEYLQDALNLLNRNQTSYADIQVDGRLGPATLHAMEQCLRSDHGSPNPLLKLLNHLQGAHYIEYARKYPAQEKYFRGWLART